MPTENRPTAGPLLFSCRGITAATFLAASLVLWPGGAAWAAPAAPPAPGLRPIGVGQLGYFHLRLLPGEATTFRMVLQNTAGRRARYLVYSAAASTAPVGGVSYGEPPGRRSATAAWLSPSLRRFRLPPRGDVSLAIRVRVPPGTFPGDYVTAVAAQTMRPRRALSSDRRRRAMNFLVTTRTIVALVVRVPGPAKAAASFGRPKVDLQQRRQVILVPIRDSGSLLMKPSLSGIVRRCGSGTALLRLHRSLDTFVPRTRIGFPWYPQPMLPAGCYRARLVLRLDENGPRLALFSGFIHVGPNAVYRAATPEGAAATARRWILPCAAAGLVAFLLGRFAALVRRRRLKRASA